MYWLSGNTCLAFGRRMPKQEFYAISLNSSLGPWASVALLGIVLDHRGCFQEEFLLHIWTRRCAVTYVLCDLLWLSSGLCVCSSRSKAIALAEILKDISTLLQLLGVVITCWTIVMKFEELGYYLVARACSKLTSVFSSMAPVSIVIFRLGRFATESTTGISFDSIAFIPVLLLCSTTVLTYTACMTVAACAMMGAGRAEARSLPAPQRAQPSLSRDTSCSLQMIRWARLTACVFGLSGALMLMRGVVTVIQLVPGDNLSTGEEVFSDLVYVLNHSSSVAQAALISSLVGPSSMRWAASSEDDIIEMAQLGGHALQDSRRIMFASMVTQRLTMPSPSSRRIAFAAPESMELHAKEGRKVCVWVLLAAAMLSVQVAVYMASGSVCIGIGGRRMPKQEYYIVSLNSSLAPWASVGLLGIVLDHRGLFREDFPLHIWTRRCAMAYTLCELLWLAGEVGNCSGPGTTSLGRSTMLKDASVLLVVGSVFMSAWMIVLKLLDMGQISVARTCSWLLAIFSGTAAASLLLFRLVRLRAANIVIVFCAISALAYTGFPPIAVWGMEAAARAAEAALPDHSGAGLEAARRAIAWARITAANTALSGALTLVRAVVTVLRIFLEVHLSSRVEMFVNVWVVLAHVTNCAQIALLSALVGPSALRHSSEGAFAEVARLGGYALQDVRRITFAGQVSALSQVCIVSFPGIYAELWSEVTKLQKQQASVACVFLPSVTSGLGLHAADPENPQHPCYCSQIYPPFQASSYLRIIPKPAGGRVTPEYKEKLAFERADATAQGVCLLVEADTPPCLWRWARRRGARRAQRLCRQNGCRAPWGCLWFAKWVENVEQAVRAGQKLLVFYKKGMAGTGKLPWHQLADRASVEAASGESGLGASQRVEVAFLDRKGYDYIELDVTSFGQQFGNLQSNSFCL